MNFIREKLATFTAMAMLDSGRASEKKRSDGLPKGSLWSDRGKLIREYRKKRHVKLRREKAARKIQRER
jgi:hypothetical protein